MSSRKLSKSSSKEDERCAKTMEEKKRKRMLSNRESARRSRIKKEQRIKDMNEQITYLRAKSNDMVRKINGIEIRYVAVQSENMVLQMQGEELRKRHESLEGMLFCCDALASGNNDKCGVMNVLEDPLLEPWLQPLFIPQSTDGIYQF